MLEVKLRERNVRRKESRSMIIMRIRMRREGKKVIIRSERRKEMMKEERMNKS
jgi:hypothetical protein